MAGERPACGRVGKCELSDTAWQTTRSLPDQTSLTHEPQIALPIFAHLKSDSALKESPFITTTLSQST